MSQAVQAHVSRKSNRIINESASRFVIRYLFTRGNRWEFKHLIRNSMGNVIWLIYNGKYFETWTFYELIVCFFSRREPGLPVELYEYRKKYILSLILMTIMLSKISSFVVADPCHHYSNLSEANRNTKYKTSPLSNTFCDKQLAGGWYRFVGAAGTKLPTTLVPENRCATVRSGWLNGEHPTVELDEVRREVCFRNRKTETPPCKYSKMISVKNCGSYYVYKLYDPPKCDSRYCGTDWMRSKKIKK